MPFRCASLDVKTSGMLWEHDVETSPIENESRRADY
jgi:hypothetical protein